VSNSLCVVFAGSVGGLAKRVVVALDVRTNDAGDLVVTKGDQYDVREGSTAAGGEVRPARLTRCCAVIGGFAPCDAPSFCLQPTLLSRDYKQ